MRIVGLVAMFAVLLGAGIVAGLVASYSRNLPDINRMADYQPSRSTRVFARDGSQLANLYTENRIWVPIAQIPVPVRNAFIATEDQHFYQHHGVDFGGIAARGDRRLASRSNFRAPRRSRSSSRDGCSSPIKSHWRAKMQEALLAIEIERYYTKDEILERYLNIIYFGSGAYGIEAAAHTYFGTDVVAPDDRAGGDAGGAAGRAVRLLAVRQLARARSNASITCSTAWSPATSSRKIRKMPRWPNRSV